MLKSTNSQAAVADSKRSVDSGDLSSITKEISDQFNLHTDVMLGGAVELLVDAAQLVLSGCSLWPGLGVSAMDYMYPTLRAQGPVPYCFESSEPEASLLEQDVAREESKAAGASTPTAAAAKRARGNLTLFQIIRLRNCEKEAGEDSYLRVGRSSTLYLSKYDASAADSFQFRVHPVSNDEFSHRPVQFGDKVFLLNPQWGHVVTLSSDKLYLTTTSDRSAAAVFSIRQHIADPRQSLDSLRRAASTIAAVAERTEADKREAERQKQLQLRLLEQRLRAEFLAKQQRHDEELKKQASEAAEAKRQRDAAEESCQALIKERESINQKIHAAASAARQQLAKAATEREQAQQEAEMLRQRQQEISAELKKREATAQLQQQQWKQREAQFAAAEKKFREEQERVKDAEAKLAAERKELKEQQAELKQKAVKQAEEDKTCSVCLDKPRDCLFGCGHLACCMDCAGELERQAQACPICRKPIENRKKVYT